MNESESDPGRAVGALWLLRACGCSDPEEVWADLNEEATARASAGWSRPRRAFWRLRQLLWVCAYELRDRLWPGRLGRSGRELHPWLALRLAVRSLRRQPGVVVAASVTLALGFGAAAAIFSVLTGFGRPLPVPEGHRVVQVRVIDRQGRHVGPGELRAWSESQRSLSVIGGLRVQSVVLTGAELDPVRVGGAEITPRVFEVLAVAPVLGSLPDVSAGDADWLVIGYRLWAERFDSDPGIVGRSVRVNGRPRPIVAVMADGFRFPYHEDLWLPLDRTSDQAIEPVGRLAPGVSTTRAADELQGILAAHWEIGAEQDAPRVLVDGFTEKRGEGGERIALMALTIIVVALVFVSCSNVSNLLLSRALVRSRMLAVHAALGAGPGQVILQLFAEALVIALAGAVLGLGVAHGAVSYIEGTLSGHWGYYWMRVALSPAVLAFTLALALATTLLSGMLPAFRVGRGDLAEPLKKENSSGGKLGRVSRLLLAGQVAFSTIAIVVALLMAAGLLRSRDVEAGFPADAVQVAALTLDGDAYEEAAQRRTFRRDLLAELTGRESVRTAALSTGLPGLNAGIGRLEIAGRAQDLDARPRSVATFAVTPEFFSVFDIGLVRGRGFYEADAAGTEPAVVVSEDFVARHFPDEEALGRRIRLRQIAPDEQWFRIVGVVSDVVIYDAYRDRPMDWVYLPMEQVDPRTFFVTLRGDDRAIAAATLGSAVRTIDPELPVAGVFGTSGVSSVTDVLDFVRRLFQTAGLLAVVGGVGAVLVAAIGLYGIISFEVQRNVPEIGIRMALGAARPRVVASVLRSGLTRLAPGLIVGTGIAYLISPLFGVFLSGVDPHDARVFVAAVGGYLLVALLASWAPARRAAALDPAQVLRAE